MGKRGISSSNHECLLEEKYVSTIKRGSMEVSEYQEGISDWSERSHHKRSGEGKHLPFWQSLKYNLASRSKE